MKIHLNSKSVLTLKFLLLLLPTFAVSDEKLKLQTDPEELKEHTEEEIYEELKSKKWLETKVESVDLCDKDKCPKLTTLCPDGGNCSVNGACEDDLCFCRIDINCMDENSSESSEIEEGSEKSDEETKVTETGADYADDDDDEGEGNKKANNDEEEEEEDKENKEKTEKDGEDDKKKKNEEQKSAENVEKNEKSEIDDNDEKNESKYEVDEGQQIIGELFNKDNDEGGEEKTDENADEKSKEENESGEKTKIEEKEDNDDDDDKKEESKKEENVDEDSDAENEKKDEKETDENDEKKSAEEEEDENPLEGLFPDDDLGYKGRDNADIEIKDEEDKKSGEEAEKSGDDADETNDKYKEKDKDAEKSGEKSESKEKSKEEADQSKEKSGEENPDKKDDETELKGEEEDLMNMLKEDKKVDSGENSKDEKEDSAEEKEKDKMVGDILEGGEQLKTVTYENGTQQFRYCFDEFDSCNEDFVMKKCFKIREVNNCVKKKKGCKYRVKKNRCCLVYSCEPSEDDQDKEVTPPEVDGEEKDDAKYGEEKDKKKEDEKNEDTDNVTPPSPEEDKKDEDSKEENNDGSEESKEKEGDEKIVTPPQESDDTEGKEDAEEGKASDEVEESLNEEEEKNKDLEHPDKEPSDDEELEIDNKEKELIHNLQRLQLADKDKKSEGEKPEGYTGEDEEVEEEKSKEKEKDKEEEEESKKEERYSMKDKLQHGQCIHKVMTEPECKKMAQSWCKNQTCDDTSHKGICQFRAKKGKCCKKYQCKPNRKHMYDNMKEGDTIIHFVFKGESTKASELLRPYHCNTASICSALEENGMCGGYKTKCETKFTCTEDDCKCVVTATCERKLKTSLLNSKHLQDLTMFGATKVDMGYEGGECQKSICDTDLSAEAENICAGQSLSMCHTELSCKDRCTCWINIQCNVKGDDYKVASGSIKLPPLLSTDKITLYIARDKDRYEDDAEWHEESEKRCKKQADMFDLGCDKKRKAQTHVFCLKHHCMCYAQYAKCSTKDSKHGDYSNDELDYSSESHDDDHTQGNDYLDDELLDDELDDDLDDDDDLGDLSDDDDLGDLNSGDGSDYADDDEEYYDETGEKGSDYHDSSYHEEDDEDDDESEYGSNYMDEDDDSSIYHDDDDDSSIYHNDDDDEYGSNYMDDDDFSEDGDESDEDEDLIDADDLDEHGDDYMDDDDEKKADKEVTDIVYDEKLHGADDEHGSDYGEDDEQEPEESEKPNESEVDSNVVTRKTFYQALIIPQEMQTALKGGGSFVEEIKKEKKGDCEVVYCDRPEMFCGVGGGTCSSKFSCNGNKCECKVDVTCNEEVDEIV